MRGLMKMPGRRPGGWLKQFQKWIEARVAKSPVDALPLPTTREFAERYGVANSTVFRQLLKYEEEGILWRSENGRFYDARARSSVDNPRPIACLFRRIEDWSLLYQELMEGIANACEQEGRATLLWHDDQLVRHGRVGSPPQFSSVVTQKRSLENFLKRYGSVIGGLILDHAWSDKALAALPPAIKEKAVILCRPSTVGVASATPDATRAAGLAITHLFAEGCALLHPVRPFSGDPAVEYTLRGIQEAAKAAACALGKELPADTPAARSHLLSTIEKSGKRTGLLLPEDNVACLLAEECAGRKLQQTKIITLQGTRRATGLPHIRNDYAALGYQAAMSLLHSGSDRSPVGFTLQP